MVSNYNSSDTIIAKFFHYIQDDVEQSNFKYDCQVTSDSDWVKYGIFRVLHHTESGRGFFQDLRMDSFGQHDIKRQNFQEGLKSKRRLNHIKSLNESYLLRRSQKAITQNQGEFDKQLKDFHIYSGDGHFHGASTHEERNDKGKKDAIGHLYSMNMRTRDVNHLRLSSDGMKKKPHDMGVLKKMEMKELRQGSRKYQKVLYVWDRAIIDFCFWDKCKSQHGIYFVSRTKKNMVKQVSGNIPFDSQSAKNSGVLKDQYIFGARDMLRMVTYYDQETQQEFEFVTNLHHQIEPGIIVQLYRMRWDIEKVFDEFKNKFHEKKAWCKSLTGKRMQAQFLVLAYNMAHRLQSELAEDYGIEDQHEQKRRAHKINELEKLYEEAGKSFPEWQRIHHRATQIGVKFIRWLRAFVIKKASLDQTLGLLSYEYSLK